MHAWMLGKLPDVGKCDGCAYVAWSLNRGQFVREVNGVVWVQFPIYL